ncbi:2-amino-4-hydroxy-6-hydroxymethyldihydropteridine diphosphokinase [Halomonas caseinilytica]|uniref:2-amino-4-hydroxy-6- hydroxymethyldihydropteridine diphosphokinase n=1 Tax=Halomonas caseinilytica TaxID=438744 RepID=UPI00084924CB|nr:2-amino-4-hydroxy-6-hydroxymethyldihydropteridine diphosphokinase [Halomonas caseinilytica]
MSLAWIGLGSNLDAPRSHVERALSELDQLPLTRRRRASSLYATRPVGPADQPDFINAVAQLETRLSPLALLDQLQALEQRHGRVRERRWGPRTLDLDLLLFDDRRLVTPRLTLPHPEMVKRAFVLVPLAEIAPALVLPDGRDVATLAADLPDETPPTRVSPSMLPQSR